VSLWKYFNCGQGAILAGPKRVLDGMFHVRRMFGGNLAVGWPAALVARHYMDGFVDRLKKAVTVSEDVYAALAKHPRLSIARVPNGTNVTQVTLRGVDAKAVASRLTERGIRMPAASASGVVTLGVNETWARRSAPDIVGAFERALA
jgi:threonine aldolase